MHTRFCLWLICLALTSCTVYEKARTYDFNDRLSYVRAGMDASRMLEMMGKPIAKVKQGQKTYYIFLSNASSQDIPTRYTTIVVQNKRVTNTRAAKAHDFESESSS